MYRITIAIFLFLCGTPSVIAEPLPPAEVESLRQELDQLKQDYESRIGKLEARLEQLVEQQSQLEDTTREVAAQEVETRQIAMANVRRTEEAIESAIEAQNVAQSYEERIKELGGSPRHEIPDAVQSAVMRETSTVFAALIGWLVLRRRPAES